MLKKTALFLSLICLSLLNTNTVHAAIYKCVGADGEITYKQTSCPVDDKMQKLIADKSSNTKYDCRIANNFARTIAIEMRSGVSSNDLFSSYGGIDAIPRTAIGVINYVYTHKGNEDSGPQRIAALSAARCSGGSYGPVSCDDFPYSFISDLGGCEAATESTLSSDVEAKPQQADAKTTDQNGDFASSTAVRTAGDIGLKSAKCENNVENQLASLFTQMRSSAKSGNSQDRSAHQKHRLKTKMENCQ